jgi:diguanylate cyclase (GGDEF)-like protein
LIGRARQLREAHGVPVAAGGLVASGGFATHSRPVDTAGPQHPLSITTTTRRLTPIAPWLLSDTVDAHIRGETVRALYQQAIIAPALTLLAAALLGGAVWSTAPRTPLLIWLGVIAAVSLARFILVMAYRRRTPGPLAMIRWERAFVVTLGGVCLAWGVGALIVMPHTVAHQALTYFFLIGIAGIAVASYSAHPTACLLCLVTLLVPVTLWFAWQDVLELRVMAAGGALYLAASIRATRNYGDFWRRTFRLSWELQQAHALAAKLARTDELTGINNRRAFLSLGRQALEQARRYNRPLTMVMIDIDFFKKINDTHGHAAGDEVLQVVAETIARSARAPDIAGRIGGEEFGLLLPETEQPEGVALAERLRRDLAAVDVGGIRFTCSFGVAARADDTVLDSLMRRADEALYRAKNEGRNRVASG